MEHITVVHLPISMSDMDGIQAMLRAEGPFCTSFPDRDVYSAALYHQESAVHGSRVRMLVDRNIFGRIVALANGTSAKQAHRIPAAIMAFAQCAGIDFEPNLALYEGLATQAKNNAVRDLAMFRAADNLHPSEMADIALGRSLKLRSCLSPTSKTPDLTRLEKPIRQYSVVYPLVLKIGCIELEGGPMAHRMRRFLDWTFDNWYFSAPVLVFAAVCFSATPQRAVLKHLRHSDRSLALKGISNCAWDLTYLTLWLQLLKRQDRENLLYLFCSCDRALRCVAQQLLARPDATEGQIESSLRQLLGAVVYEHYVRLNEQKDDPTRLINQVGIDIGNHKAQIITALEQELRKSSSLG
ncbi:MAG: hypothetical protein ABSG52_04485 [Terriglobales bacterium]|jgi:hypothetical protein